MRMVERVRGHRFYNGNVIENVSEVRECLGDFRAALAVPVKFELGREQGRIGLYERVLLAHDHFFGNWLAVIFLQRRFVVEQVELARRAAHEEVNDSLGFGLEMRMPWGERVRAGNRG